MNKSKIAVKATIQQNLVVSKALLGKLSLTINIDLNSENYCISRRHRLLSYTTKQPLSNFEPQKPRKKATLRAET